MKSSTKGKLIVKPTRAKLTRDTDVISKMDPYVVVMVGDQKQRTKTHEKAGKTPAWFDVFEFNRNKEDTLEFEVHDDDFGSDDLVGTGSLPLKSICVSKPAKFSEPVKVTYKGKDVGEVYFEIDFVPK